MLAWFALRLAQVLPWLETCLMLARFAVHLAQVKEKDLVWLPCVGTQVLFTLTRDLFNFRLVALRLAQVLFNLATVLFNVGLVCLAFSPGLVYFG